MKLSRLLFTVGVAVALAACHSKKQTAAESLPPVAVRTVIVENKQRPSSEEVVGTVRAKLRAVIEAKVSARIEALLVSPGQMVKAGDLIAQLDPREIQAKLDQALALREQATRDLARARELLNKKITTQADFDAVQARASVAEGAAREMETMLGYTKVIAPFDGIVTRKLVDVGDLAAPGKPIVEMEDPRALRFEADVPEALIGHVKTGAQLPVPVSAGAARVEGTVAEVAPVADAATRTFLVKLDLPAAEGVRSGQFGRVWIPTGKSKSIRLPQSSVVTRGQVECVFVVVNQHSELRIVR
jgi:RND family efflux transporter MFP subunit